MTVMAAQQPALSVRELAFSYGHRPHTDTAARQGWSIQGVSFDVREGEVLGVIGPNGSGKTSLLKLLAKVLQPEAGAVDVFGRALGQLSQQEVARSVALVPQDTVQPFPFTIAELVLMGRFPHHAPSWRFGGMEWETADELALADRVMREMDVRHLAHRYLHEVSGGERQRAVIARALVQEPRVLLLDEPTAFLDLNHQLDIMTVLRRVSRQQGLTVVMVSHDLNLASQVCDRLLLLRNGELQTLGTPEDVLRPEIIKQVYGCEVFVDRHPVNGRPRVTL